MAIYTLERTGAHLDKIMAQDGSVLSSGVNPDGSQSWLTPTFSLDDNTWYQFQIFASFNGNLTVMNSPGSFDLSAANISDGYISLTAHRSNDNMTGTRLDQTAWRAQPFDDTNTAINLPDNGENSKQNYYMHGSGAFKTGTSPTLRLGYTSNISGTDDVFWNQFSIRLMETIRTV